MTRSRLEESFLELCAQHGLERPRPGARVAALEVDFLFAAQRLVVEVDGYRFHRTRNAFDGDRERHAILARHGFRTLRFSHRQVTRTPSEVAAAVLPALRSSA